MNARPLEKASFRAPGIVRRKRLLAAARALLSHRDLDEIGLADVARAARIPKGSAYHYYGDILDLYVQLIAVMGEEMLQDVRRPICSSNIRAICLSLWRSLSLSAGGVFELMRSWRAARSWTK